MTRHLDEDASRQDVGVASHRSYKSKESNPSVRFIGTDNPRHLRAIAALLRRPMPREALDTAAGASNGPELVAELRRRGLEVPCERISFLDRDGRNCRPGVYSLTERDRRRLFRWLTTDGRGVKL
jgi:hypothetical protein